MITETNSQARFHTLTGVLGLSIFAIGLLQIRDILIRPGAMPGFANVPSSVVFFSGPLLIGFGVTILLTPLLSQPARIPRAAKGILLIGGSVLVFVVFLLVASYVTHSESIGFVGTLLGVLLGPPALVLLVSGGVLLQRAGTLAMVLALAAAAFSWKLLHGERSLVAWTPIGNARSTAAAKHKLIMYEFSAEWCGPCKLMEREVFSDPHLARRINENFIPVRVVDRQREEGTNPPAVADLQRRFAIRAFPTIVIADENLNQLRRASGYRHAGDFASLLETTAGTVERVPTAIKRIDDFEASPDWKAYPYAVTLNISQDAAGHTGHAMRLDFDFHGDARYAAARKDLDVELPPDYQFSFWLRADAPVNNLEFKLVDANGNVWWVNRQDFEYPREWKKITYQKSDFEFAWGPSGGGEPQHISAIEIVVTAGRGGKGTVWIDDLALEQLSPR